MNPKEFQDIFKALTGIEEGFPWQEKLFFRFAKGDIPSCCDIPTGLGKTSVVALWLIALAKHPETVPRRLVYVVNRRTVVDQTTEEVQKLRRNLAAAGLDAPLRKLCAMDCDCPLAVSTLRGQFADNREWSCDPCRPAVIVGTVDMIGSRILFSGYGVGFKTKPLHAGFLGQDTLIVHDEAHLEPAFQELLTAIHHEQKRCGDPRRLRIIEMSATTRGEVTTFGLTKADEDHPEVDKRLNAPKELRLHALNDAKKLPEKIADLALCYKDSNLAVLVFARTVESVEKIAAALRKAKQQHVEKLTGTLRGKERDALVENPVFRRFRPQPSPAAAEPTGTVYLVCTSAGEVGVNISADHLICDLSTFESMAQRFGRVNRFGNRTDTEINVVHPEKFDVSKELEVRLERTLELLRQLNGVAGPNALRRLDSTARIAAFSPKPVIPPSSEILFDCWSLTSIVGNLPGRPPVEPYLHGITEYEPPQTQVAWRKEVEIVASDLLETHKPEDLLADYPLKPHELLRDNSDRVFERLSTLANQDPENASRPVWLIHEDGMVEPLTLGELANKKEKERVSHCTVLLPPCVGGLSGGMLDGNAEEADDVADDWFDLNDQALRLRTWDSTHPNGMRLIREIDTNPTADEDEETEGAFVIRRFWRWYEKPSSADNEGSASAQKAISLIAHTRDVEARAQRFAERLGLSVELVHAVLLAGRFHDLGKKREIWQRSIGNFQPGTWLAKSDGRMSQRSFSPYRHEFGSLLDASNEADFQSLSEDMKDMVLHLIAAHHGRARPHFSAEESLDAERNGLVSSSMAADVPNRFARLQRRYGRWGLAYLESLLRAADYAASANPSQTVEDTQ